MRPRRSLHAQLAALSRPGRERVRAAALEIAEWMMRDDDPNEPRTLISPREHAIAQRVAFAAVRRARREIEQTPEPRVLPC